MRKPLYLSNSRCLFWNNIQIFPSAGKVKPSFPLPIEKLPVFYDPLKFQPPFSGVMPHGGYSDVKWIDGQEGACYLWGAMKTLQIVIPLFNEIHTLPALWERLECACNTLQMEWSVLFVNDGSADGTEDELDAMAVAHKNVAVLHLSRNFGHQAALTAGIENADADAVVLMDGDLQDTPETIPLFVDAWEKGAEVAYAVRTSRKEGILSRLAFKSFYRVLGKLSGIALPADAGIFSLLDRKVLKVIQSMPEHNRYFPGMRAFAGFRQVGVPADRGARFADKPRVGFKGLVKLACDAVFSFSYVPLRLMTWSGLCIALAAFAYLAWALFQKFVTHAAISGWTSILGAVLLLGGIQIVMLGVVGEYIARIYEETKKRPAYVAKRFTKS